MIRRLLVANRGEIAVRVIRACRDLGVKSVAVYSEVDAHALHVEMADQAVCIGPGPARHSYLDVPSIIAAAKGLEADAVHPGYGFLAENAGFAQACLDHGLIFVGPRPDAIHRLGDKVEARRTVSANGVPVVPGSDGALVDVREARSFAEELVPPVLLKAKGGGGGRGMRVVRDLAEFDEAWSDAAREAAGAFGDPGLYMERYLEAVRHVEIQVMADQHGNVISLGERDCSVQRRHQKLIEEAPSPGLQADVRRQMADAAVLAAQAVNYVGAGTVEFLFDRLRQEFYFIEMNARIQVEHPVTEMLTGVDLVAEQILVAAGNPLSFTPLEFANPGHALECRINAEDPGRQFFPSPGTLTAFRPPGGPGVRVDTHCFPGYAIPPNYDSLMAKVVTYGRDRDETIRRMRRALSEFDIKGVQTTIPFHQRVLSHPDFVAGNFTTSFIEQLAGD